MEKLQEEKRLLEEQFTSERAVLEQKMESLRKELSEKPDNSDQLLEIQTQAAQLKTEKEQ